MTPYAIEVALHELRQLNVAGDRAAALARWASLFEVNRAAVLADLRLADMFLFTAVFNRDMEGAERLMPVLAPRCGPTRLSVSTHEGIPSAELFLWTSAGPGGNQFVFHPALFDLPQHVLYTIYTRWNAFLQFAAVVTEVSGLSGVALVDVGDWSSRKGLSFCDNDPSAHLIPDSNFLSSDAYAATLQAYRANPRPWAERRPTALWRGGSTGIPADGIMSLPRVQLCKIGLETAGEQLIDAGISHIVQARGPEETAMLQASGVLRDSIPITQFLHYKYQIDIDGNSNSWPGMFQKLLTGSPVLKVTSPAGYRQWYYDRLVPWINFIPIRSDMSDLVPVLRFLLENDGLAERIGTAGAALATSMTVESETRRSFDVVAGAFAAHEFRMRVGAARPGGVGPAISR